MPQHGGLIPFLTHKENSRIVLRIRSKFLSPHLTEVMEAQKLNFWVMFIPIFLVYHVYRHKGVVEGRRPQIPEIVRDSDLPAQARGPFKELLTLLVEHYTDLLGADGDGFEAMVRTAYKSRTNYLLFLNRLSQCERGLNRALMPQLDGNVGDVREVMKRMEAASEKLQRERAARIFP